MTRKPYRWRTWMRGILPYPLWLLFPKGHDCGEGNHEMYRASPLVRACYHCKLTLGVSGIKWKS